MFEANSRSSSSNWVLVNAVRILFELLMEFGDLGGGVGVLLREGDASLGAETS